MNNDVKADFTLLISGLLAEGMVALGVMKDPTTQRTEKRPKHAAYVIDILDMLKQKTSGNLAEEEAKVLEQGVHQLRMIYIAELNRPPEEKAADQPMPPPPENEQGKEEKAQEGTGGS
ncbi:MAG: DUF1844 domain-containing protein [Candidatus Omnitrophica bacterium]|nr:DUF1844 domain-containing protein [Candidatus Omnitrophota bacterium]